MTVGRGWLWLIPVFALVQEGCRTLGTRPDTLPSAAHSGMAAHNQHQVPVDEVTGHREPGATPPRATPPTVEVPGTAPKAKPPPTPRFRHKADVYDSRGEAYALLQAPKTAMRHFPADAVGNVDWVATLSQGLINPRTSLTGKGSMRRRFDNIVMRETRDMPWVNFPHAQHTAWLDCSSCHPEPFSEHRGENQISMETIMRGQHCGTCHDRVAFSIFACERCHSIPHPGSPPRWW